MLSIAANQCHCMIVCRTFSIVCRKDLCDCRHGYIFRNNRTHFYLNSKIKALMKPVVLCIIMFTSVTAMAQRDTLPYAAFPPAPDHYGAGTVVSRLLDGLGFRYYWATEGLRPIDLAFKPSPEARTSMETLQHIYSLSNMIINAVGGSQIPPGQYKTFEELRKATLENLRLLMRGSLSHMGLIFLLAALGAVPSSYAQEARLSFQHFSMEQGLPSNAISALLFDHEGYLWASTRNGLSRYDGYSFTTYKFDPRDPGSLNNNLCIALYEDHQNNIWVGTVEGGLNRFDRKTGKFTNYRPPQPAGRVETVLRAVSAICEDRYGYLWVGSSSGELRRFDKQTGEFSTWGADLGYQAQSGDAQPFDRINFLYPDSRGDLWVGNRTGLHRLILSEAGPSAPGPFQLQHYVHDDRDPASLSTREAQFAFEDHAGRFWVSTDSGLDLLDRSTTRFSHYPVQHRWSNASDNFYGSMTEDNQDNLWFSSFDGIYRFDSRTSLDGTYRAYTRRSEQSAFCDGQIDPG